MSHSNTRPCDSVPFVSLLIPMHNESRYIEQCLESVFMQDYPEMEVYLFDGMSSDDSKRIAERIIGTRENAYLLDNPAKIQSAAWNEGIRLCKGDIIIIVSAHSVLEKDFVRKSVDTLEQTGADLAGGPTAAHGENFFAKAVSYALSSPFGVGNARSHYTKKMIETDTVFMGACRRAVYLRIGGYDEEMVRNQDDEFSYRLLENEGKIVCNPDIKSRYFNRATVKSLWNQYFQYGFWKVRVLQKHPGQMRTRQLVPAIFVSVLLLTGFLSIFLTVSKLLFAAVLTVYLSATITAAVWLSKRSGKDYIPVFPLVFMILHVSYGFGFLIGLLRFSDKWKDKNGRVPMFQQDRLTSSYRISLTNG